MNFVSEKEIQAARTSDEPEEPVDHRPLYERLKEVRDKKQLEFEESQNQLRGLDTDETDFLSMVDKVKEEQELKKRKDEEEILRLQKATVEAAVPTLSDIKPISEAPPRRPSKQAAILSSAIRKRKHSNEPELDQQTPAKKPDPESLHKSHPTGKQTTALKLIGVLPGIGDYSASSDDEDNSDSSESGDELILPSIQSNLADKDNGNGSTPNKSMASKCPNSGNSSNSSNSTS